MFTSTLGYPGGLMSGVMGTSMASGMAMLPIRPDIMHPLKVRVQPAIVGGKGKRP